MAGHPNPKIRAANAGLTIRHGNGQLDWSGKVRFLPERLDQPARWTRPRMIFVNSLSDLFHEDVEMRHLAAIWSVMALTPRHTYQILTKRPENIRPMLSQPRFLPAYRMQAGYTATTNRLATIEIEDPVTRPLPNVWIGTSVEDQAAADKRIPHLLKAPAAIRFLSCEPLLGPLDLSPWLWEIKHFSDPETGEETSDPEPSLDLDWVIVGGESGPRARPMHPDWARELQVECTAADVPFFYKQTGEWSDQVAIAPGATVASMELEHDGHIVEIFRVGKHAAGRLLDGREWNEMPT